VNWLRSFSQYDLDEWFGTQVADDWAPLRAWTASTLQAEGALQDVVSLLGIEALASEQRITLRIGQALREDLLQQDSFDDIDASCSPARLLAMLRVVHAAGTAMGAALARGVPVTDITEAGTLAELGQMGRWPAEAVNDSATELSARVAEELSAL
jgi:V/A-type H+-transporting ATPase subunit A